MTQQVWEEATIYIEAVDVAHAQRMAITKANTGDVEWRFLEAPDPIHLLEVTEVT